MDREKEAPAEAPIVESEYVKELLALSKEDQLPVDKRLSEAIGHISKMGKQFASVVDELKAMRRELQGSQEQSCSLKVVLQRSVKALKANAATLWEWLARLKGVVTEGCKNTLAVVKERGIGALDSAARFFHVRPGLESLRNAINDGTEADEKAISRVGAVSAGYHGVERHLENIGCALIGEEAAQEAKVVDKLTKTVQAPYRAKWACYLAARDSLDKTVSSLECPGKAAEKQPFILKAMKKHKETPPLKEEEFTLAAVHDER